MRIIKASRRQPTPDAGRWTLLLFGALLLFNCTNSRPRDKDELIVGISTFPSDFDPRSGADQASDRLHALVYNGLFENGEDLQPAPVLVEKILQAGPLVYEFRLRDGIKFHDGRKLTSADAAYTLRTIVSGEITSFRRGDLSVIDKIDAPDPLTLRLTLSKPFAALLTNLNVGIVPEGTSAPQVKSAPVGTGPFKYVSSVQGREILLAANPDYFRGSPGMKSIRLRAIADGSVRTLEMKKGALDLISEDLTADNFSALVKDPRFAIATRPGTTFAYLVFNCTHPPFDRPGVRRALAMLLDREGIVANLQGGRATLADSLLPTFHWAYAPAESPLRFDPTAAEQLLDAEGLRRDARGRRFSFVYRSSTEPDTLAVAQVFQQSLKEAGIEMSLVPTYWGFFFSDLQQGKFDLAGGRWIGLTDPDVYRLRFGSAFFPPDGLNRGRFKNSALDQLIEQGAATPDPVERKKIYGGVQKVFRDEMPYIPLFHTNISIIYNKDLEGVTPAPDGSFRNLRFIHRSK